MEQSKVKNTDQPESRAENGEMNVATGEDTNVNELKEVVVDKEEDSDLAAKLLQENKADGLENNKVDFISEVDNTNGVPEDSMMSETKSVECEMTKLNGESEEKNNSEEKGEHGSPTETVDKVDDQAEVPENETEVVTDDASGLNDSESMRIQTDETDNDSTGRDKENETVYTDKKNKNDDVSNKDVNTTEDVTGAEPGEGAEKAAEEAPNTENKDIAEMGQSESHSPIIPGQITDNEDSIVSNKGLISQTSRQSVTFSDTEKKETDEKTLEKVVGTEPVKTRKSLMQILDEIASAATGVVDFDTAGKNR